jgi:hypothetical protein
MGYAVKVFLDKVVCRQKESVTTADLFRLVTTVATDSNADVEIQPIQRLRSGEQFTYAQVIFDGYAEAPTLGLVVLGFDVDRNRGWTDNEDTIREITGATENKIKERGFIKDVASGDAWGFIKTWTVEMIDTIISRDDDDRVLDWSELIPLTGGYGAPISIRLHAKTKDPSDVGADYSVFLTVTYEQMLQGISDARTTKVWEECKTPKTPSTPENWVGRWGSTGGSPSNLSTSILISKNKLYVNMLDVTVTELNAKTNEQVVTTSEAVPISRVFMELGFKGSQRTLESAEPQTVFSQTKVADVASLGLGGGGGLPDFTIERDSRNGAGSSPYFTRFTVESSISSDATSIYNISGPEFGVEKLALHEQIGPDFLWLGNQAVLEIYRIIENGVFTRFGLIYLRPVTNVLYRDGRTFPVAKTLEHMVL